MELEIKKLEAKISLAKIQRSDCCTDVKLLDQEIVSLEVKAQKLRRAQAKAEAGAIARAIEVDKLCKSLEKVFGKKPKVTPLCVEVALAELSGPQIHNLAKIGRNCKFPMKIKGLAGHVVVVIFKLS